MENEETEISTPPNAPPHRQTEMEPNKVLLPSIDSDKDVDAINGAEPTNKANILQDNS